MGKYKIRSCPMRYLEGLMNPNRTEVFRVVLDSIFSQVFKENKVIRKVLVFGLLGDRQPRFWGITSLF